MRSTIPTRAPESDWHALNATAEYVRRGAPMWELGWDARRADPGGAREDPGDVPLVLVTGLLDDTRPDVVPGDPFHGTFALAYRWQDTWDVDEHTRFWARQMPHCPVGGHKRSHTGALAYAVALAVTRGLDLDEYVAELSRQLQLLAEGPPIKGLIRSSVDRHDLQRSGALALARRIATAPRRRLDLLAGRLPRVALCDEPQRPPIPVDEWAEGEWDESWSIAGPNSLAVRRAAKAAADKLTAPPPTWPPMEPQPATALPAGVVPRRRCPR